MMPCRDSPLFAIPGQPQHVLQRGNNREDIFRAEGDYHFHLEKLAEAAKKHKCDLHAYVLMTNHVHLLVAPRQEHREKQGQIFSFDSVPANYRFQW